MQKIITFILFVFIQPFPIYSDIKKLENILSKAVDMKSRNRLIVQSYGKGYYLHMITKVLGVSQAAIYGVIKNCHFHLV